MTGAKHTLPPVAPTVVAGPPNGACTPPINWRIMSNIKSKAGLAAGVTGSVLAVPAMAMAQVTDPTGGALDTGVADISGFVTTYGAPAIFGLAAVGIGIRVGLKYFKRAAGSV